MKKVLNILLAAGLILSLTACGNTQKETEATIQPPTVASPTQPQTTTSVSTETPKEKTAPTEQAQTTTSVSTETPKEKTAPTEQAQEEQNMTLQMTIGSTPVSVSWEDNDAVQALKELCRNQPLTISMYGGFEQVGSIGTNLPANDVQTTTSAGDIVLYSGNQMVVFYGSNSWAYTRLGHITDQSADGMTQLLSGGDTTITITLE